MIIVTGGCGFIGSQVVKALVRNGKEVIVVDDLADGRKFENLNGLAISDYLDKDVFLAALIDRMDVGPENPIEAIVHMGAISSTTDWDGRKVMAANYDYSKIVLNYCSIHHIPFIYASSASVYGRHNSSVERRRNEEPLNVYGFSKLLFDNYVRNGSWGCKIVGLRIFNCYGPGEQFKGSQASPFFRYYKTLRSPFGFGDSKVKIFDGPDGFGGHAENTMRDFVYVDDVVRVILWALRDEPSTIVNVGTGVTKRFQDIADLVLGHFLGKGKDLTERVIRSSLPDHLKGRAQTYTCANLEKLRKAGYKEKFTSQEEGCARYMKWLDKNYSEAWDAD